MRRMICSVCHQDVDWGTGLGTVCSNCRERLEREKREEAISKDWEVVSKCAIEVKLE